MITHAWRFSAALLLLLPPIPTSAQETPRTNTGPQVLDVQGGKIRVAPVATGLFHPWSLAFTDARTILVTERNGRLRMICDGVLNPEPIWTSPTPPDESGDSLHFVTLHPNFARNQMVYVSYPKRGERGITLAVARGRLSGAKLTDVQEIFVADAWETGGNLKGRIFFTPDGLLFVTVGDRDRICCKRHRRQQSPDEGTTAG
jgi:glucose/arabinose dehydrogenase